MVDERPVPTCSISFGGFDTDTWASTGIGYRVEVDSAAPVQELAALVEKVDAVAEIPRPIRSGAPVRRTN